MAPPLHLRWLGTVPYREALDLQHSLRAHLDADWLLLLEHPSVYTVGVRGDLAHIRVKPHDVGADLVRTDRGGDVTYHGPGQLVGYPILTVPGKRGGGMADTVAHVHMVEQVVIDVLTAIGLVDVGRLPQYPGVWVAPGSPNPRKIAAIGVRLDRGRSMHGFALNVHPDMTMFNHIVPCGITDFGVTSIAAEGIEIDMGAVVDATFAASASRWGTERPLCTEARVLSFDPVRVETAPMVGVTHHRAVRLAQAQVTKGLAISQRKPEWLRAQLTGSEAVLGVQRTIRELGLVTVCEEAGCPNVSECWADGTATFMLNGDRCTRACGFCLVDTQQPFPLDPSEPARVAEAVDRMGLSFAVLTAVARDDLVDGGASGFVGAMKAIRSRTPLVQVEVLIPDCKGRADALQMIFDARPEVLNHNLETVARLQRAVRPQAGYARSLTLLGRAKSDGLTVKSGLIVGMGERVGEVRDALADLAGVGVDIVTIGQYLRPTSRHIPVARWWEPQEFEDLRRFGEDELGIGHVEASPLTRSSYHAKQAAAGSVPAGVAVPVAIGRNRQQA